MWDEKRVLGYIQNQVQENSQLEYKGSGKINDNEGIAKAISAMANSAGGIVIFGIAEYREKDKKHLPEKIDPINFNSFSRESLENIIQTGIQPKIDGILIHPIQIGQNSNQGVYVVEIPQSNTAHQVKYGNFRYYKRHNFLSEPMEDYEIRDVMGRGQYPKIELEFNLIYFTGINVNNIVQRIFKLDVWAINNGKSFAKYVEAVIHIPDTFLSNEQLSDNLTVDESRVLTGPSRYIHYKNDIRYYVHYAQNFIDEKFMPILPTRSLRLEKSADVIDPLPHETIYWEVYADNSPPQKGQISIDEIKTVDMYGRPI